MGVAIYNDIHWWVWLGVWSIPVGHSGKLATMVSSSQEKPAFHYSGVTVDFISHGTPVAPVDGNLWFVLAIGCNVNWLTLLTINFPRQGPRASEVKCSQLYCGNLQL